MNTKSHSYNLRNKTLSKERYYGIYKLAQKIAEKEKNVNVQVGLYNDLWFFVAAPFMERPMTLETYVEKLRFQCMRLVNEMDPNIQRERKHKRDIKMLKVLIN